ncbi:ATP-binding cassette sub-family C member 2 [Phytophthora ramorum]|uniref:ATP-binding cassette sub-family C member 2 n=1 Tax=Phytophthora ramorum TaxID=164328 RepID=UPI0030ACA42C|nr:ATP-binding cassette sub-family C member 2 [Phytophthora ramorum]
MDHWPEIKQDYVKAPPTPDAVSLRESTTKPEAALFSLQPNPLERASLVSTVLAQWVYPMISLGSKKVLEMEDMWPLCPRDSCQALEIRFRRVYEPEKSHIFGISPVAMAFAVAFRGELTVVFAGCMLYVLALGMQSYVAQGLLEFLNDEDNIFHISSGYWLMAMMTGSSLVAVLSLNYVFFVSARIGVNMRSLTMSLIYDKALRLSSEARQEYTTGEVLTLMSVDTERVFHFVAHGPWLVMGPLGFAISIMLVGVLFDFYSSIAGAVVLIAVMVLSVQQGDRIARLQKQLLQVIDERVKVTSEALQGVRVMKFYAWEDSLAQRVNKLRVREVALLRKFHLYQVVNSVMLFVTPTYLSGVTLGLYVLTRNRITVVEAFTLIAMVNICRTALSQLPQAIGGYSKAKISFARIDEFLLADEIVAQSLQPPSSPARALVAGARGSTSKGCISVRDASFRWPDMAPTEGVLVVTSAMDEPKVDDGSHEGSYVDVVARFPQLGVHESRIGDDNTAKATEETFVEDDIDPMFKPPRESESAQKTTESPVETKEETNDAVLAGKLVQSEDRVRGTIESEDDSGSTVAQLLHAEYQSTGSTTASWPSRGTIRFDQLCLRYRPELPLVLKGVDMDVAAGEKVGICGRTGAGKSSLMVALFRICDFDSGRVLIDDVDISSINVRELRRSLAIIPQDPVLFSGPLRENLDPFHEYSDERLWAVLKQVHMADKLRRWGSGLDFEVAEGGDNLSVGQRQLLCIGRALLKDSQVVVLDEATANVDTATDALIQTTIQETFAAKTVLIIAHRINTILHCDKIAVLDAGRVAEFGCPSDLLAQPQSVFAALAKRSGTVVM